MRQWLLAALFHVVLCVDHAKFRTCSQTGFCRRRRNAAIHPYVVAPGSLTLDKATGTVQGRLHGGEFGVSLNLHLIGYPSGVTRLRVTETNPLHGKRWEPTDILEADLTPSALRQVDAAELGEAHPLTAAVVASEAMVYTVGNQDDGTPILVAIHMHPFRAALYHGGEKVVSLNPAGKLYFEHHRKRDDASKPIAAPDADVHGGKTVVDYGEDGLAVYSDGTKQQRGDDSGVAAADTKNDALWEESFGQWRDSKPFGPSSVGLDLTFDDAAHVYGLAEHAAPLNLPSTTGPGAKYRDPYRMYTLDVYDYELDSPMALYGGVPLLLAHTANRTVGTLWFNPSETFIDISRSSDPSGGSYLSQLTGSAPSDVSTSAYWMSESGVIDLMLLPGPSPADIFRQYAGLTGVTPLYPSQRRSRTRRAVPCRAVPCRALPYLDSTRLDSTRLDSTRLDSTRLDSTPSTIRQQPSPPTIPIKGWVALARPTLDPLHARTPHPHAPHMMRRHVPSALADHHALPWATTSAAGITTTRTTCATSTASLRSWIFPTTCSGWTSSTRMASVTSRAPWVRLRLRLKLRLRLRLRLRRSCLRACTAFLLAHARDSLGWLLVGQVGQVQVPKARGDAGALGVDGP